MLFELRLTSPKGLTVTMLYEAGSLSTKHVSVRARIRLTGSWRTTEDTLKTSTETADTDNICTIHKGAKCPDRVSRRDLLHHKLSQRSDALI